jgi:hypothetical protein
MAAEAARTVGRRLRARRRNWDGRAARVRGHAGPAPAPPTVQPEPIPLPRAGEPRMAGTAPPMAGPEPDAAAAEPRADEAQLDALRGSLVRELDRLAAEDECSASFRRAG